MGTTVGDLMVQSSQVRSHRCSFAHPTHIDVRQYLVMTAQNGRWSEQTVGDGVGIRVPEGAAVGLGVGRRVGARVARRTR